MSTVTIVTGSAGAGKTERLLQGYQSALRQAQGELRPGTTLWLTPTQRVQKAVTQELVRRSQSGCFAPNVLTFDLFAKKVLDAAGSPASPISSVMKRLLLRRITSRMKNLGQLRHFRSIADTTGFLDLVSSFISELKREEIWPERFVEACHDRRSSFAQRDRELGQIYMEYQRHLSEQNWYDNEGRFWLARTALENGSREPFATVRYLAVDGFTDFTQTQYEILGHLAGWIDQVTISIPIETPVVRTDLFSKPTTAISRIQEHLPKTSSFRLERLTPQIAMNSANDPKGSRPQWARSISIIADRLFSNPHGAIASPDGQGLEVIAAAGQQGEWQSVAQRIKQMLALGRQPNTTLVRPRDIVIGLRAISDDGPRLRDYMRAAGLPVWCEGELPFSSSSIVKSLVGILQLELEDWPFDRLLSVLDSNYFRPTWTELKDGKAIRSIAAALRQLRINSGRETILRVLDSREAHSVGDVEERDFLSVFAGQALPVLNRLSRTLEPLRASHSLDGWIDVIARIVEELGWLETTTPADDELVAIESRDLDLFQRIVRTAAEADQKLHGDDSAKSLSLSQFVGELRDLLNHETLPAEPEAVGCVRILGVEQIRNLDIPHLFLMGMTENSFPMNRSEDCLFSESERQDLIARGVALRHRLGQHADEMSLFYSIVTRARCSLTLSYPAMNTKGQPVFPSPYLTAITSLFTDDSYKQSSEGQLDPVPPTDLAMTFSDLRLVAMSEARNGNPNLFRSVLELDRLKRAALNTLAACNVADHRFHQRGFTAYEGRLDLSQNLNVIRSRFGSIHQFSTTELEAYAKCPFQFWLANVLKIQPLESPEESTDVVARGTLLHEIIATLQVEGVLDDPDQLGKRFRELVDHHLLSSQIETKLQKSLVKIERTILREWADAFTEQQTEYQQKIGQFLNEPRSLPPEIPFGQLPDAPVSAEDNHPAIVFGTGPNSVSVRGRIDRVDVGKLEGRPAYIVIDYKTGMRPTSTDKELLSGRSIQLALYLSAIRQLGLVGLDAVPFQMGYWALRDTGFKQGTGGSKFGQLDVGVIQRMEAVLESLLPQLAEEIRSGRFVVENSDVTCTSRCAYRTVCRVNQLRPLADALGKVSPDRLDPKIDET